jgi:hypothetical protein
MAKAIDHDDDLVVVLAALLASTPIGELSVGDIIECLDESGFAIVRKLGFRTDP